MQIQNFGRNLTFTPKYFYKPKTEQEVLDILNKHRNGQVRAIGSGHAWSKGLQSHDAFLDIAELNEVEIKNENGKDFVYVGGGCKLERLLETLSERNLTLPAMGGIMRQSVAGIASTATHGTGKSSFSHFINEVRVAAYDESGQAKIFEFKNGDELRAARTALGCMGIILSLKIPCIPKYWITERSKKFETLEEILSDENNWPLQQTVVIPHLWHFFSFQRKVDSEPKNKFKYRLMRYFDYFTVEIMPHVILKIILLIKNNKKIIISYYKDFLPKFLTGVTSTNQDYIALTLHTRHHYTFRHVEMEVFIPEDNIRVAFETIREVTDWFAGTKDALNENLKNKLEEKGLLEMLNSKKSTYVLHYTPFIRKVMPDDSLIGMTANNKTHYAIGFFTYEKESLRAGYYDFTKTMAMVLNNLHDSKLHWGKHFPLEYNDIERLYPDIKKFKEICKKHDPNGVFQNDFTKKVLGF